MYVCMYVCIYIYIHMCMNTYVCVYIDIYTHTHIQDTWVGPDMVRFAKYPDDLVLVLRPGSRPGSQAAIYERFIKAKFRARVI